MGEQLCDPINQKFQPELDLQRIVFRSILLRGDSIATAVQISDSIIPRVTTTSHWSMPSLALEVLRLISARKLIAPVPKFRLQTVQGSR